MIVLSGLLGSFFPAFLFCIAELKIDGSLPGILNALTPLFTILIGAAFSDLKVGWQNYAGVITGFTGLSLLFLSRGSISLNYLSYASLVLIATIFYGVNVNIISRYMNAVSSLHIAALAFAFLIIPSAVILYVTGYFQQVVNQKSFLWSTGAGILLGVFGTAIASVLFYILVKRAGGLFASTVTYGIPFVAVLWGIFDGEYITAIQVMCLLIILVGVYLANRPLPNNDRGL